MKLPSNTLRFALIFLPALLAAAGVDVPDLETRIRDSGGDVPASALPELTNPPPAPLPGTGSDRDGPQSVDAPALSEAPIAPEPPEGAIEPSLADADEGKGKVRGWASLGAGSPGTLLGELAVGRSGGDQSGFALRFAYDGADGFGGESTGSGFFDRRLSLGFAAASPGLPQDIPDSPDRRSSVTASSLSSLRDLRAESRSGTLPWRLSLGLSERTDGLQGLNAEHYSLTARDAAWQASAGIPVSQAAGLHSSIALSGAVYQSFPDRPGTSVDAPALPASAVAGAPLKETGGYRLDPLVSLSLLRGPAEISLTGAYGYESLVGRGERNSGYAALETEVTLGRIFLDARGGFYLASDAQPLFPFSLAARWESPSSVLSSLRVSGGLDAFRSSADTLIEKDPFVNSDLLGRTASDWYGSGSALISLPAAQAAQLPQLGLSADYRSTAFGRGILTPREIDEPVPGQSAGLIPVSLVSRQSLETALSLLWGSSFWSAEGTWRSEWLQGDWADPARGLEASLSFFDAGAKRLWEAGTRLGLDLTGSELPLVSLSLNLRPAQALSLSLTFDDIVPLASGTSRIRDSLYAGRSGILALSGRLDF